MDHDWNRVLKGSFGVTRQLGLLLDLAAGDREPEGIYFGTKAALSHGIDSPLERLIRLQNGFLDGS